MVCFCAWLECLAWECSFLTDGRRCGKIMSRASSAPICGDVAQLGEHHVRNVGVGGSSPLISTTDGKGGHLVNRVAAFFLLCAARLVGCVACNLSDAHCTTCRICSAQPACRAANHRLSDLVRCPVLPGQRTCIELPVVRPNQPKAASQLPPPRAPAAT